MECVSGKVLFGKTEELLSEAIALLTDVFSILTYSPILRFLCTLPLGGNSLSGKHALPWLFSAQSTRSSSAHL